MRLRDRADDDLVWGSEYQSRFHTLANALLELRVLDYVSHKDDPHTLHQRSAVSGF